MQVLIVKTPFAGREVGDRIADPAEIAAILAGEASAHVVRVEEPELASPSSAPAKTRKE